MQNYRTSTAASRWATLRPELPASLVRQNFGPFVAMTQFYEQGNVYNSLNTSLMIY